MDLHYFRTSSFGAVHLAEFLEVLLLLRPLIGGEQSVSIEIPRYCRVTRRTLQWVL